MPFAKKMRILLFKYSNPNIFREGIYPLVNLKKYKTVIIRKGNANTAFLRLGIYPFNTGLETAPSKTVYKSIVKSI